MKSFIILWIIGSALIDSGMAKAVELKTLAQDTAPKWIMKTEEGRQVMGGMCPAILSAIEKKSGDIHFSWENNFYPVKRILSLLEAGGKIQLVVSMGYNAKRAQTYIYSRPLYKVNHVVAVRRDDPVQVSSFEDIAALGDKGRILTIFGTATSTYLKERPENLLIHGIDTPAASLLLLTRKRGRFFYYYDLGLDFAILHGGFNEQIKILPTTFRTYEHYIIYSKNVPRTIIKDIDMIIEKMKKSGEMEVIRNRFRAK